MSDQTAMDHQDDAKRRLVLRVNVTGLAARHGAARHPRNQGSERAISSRVDLPARRRENGRRTGAQAVLSAPHPLARDDRKELVGLLAAEGMSTRAIAPIVGASDQTVRADIERVREITQSDPRPATVTSLDGRERPARVEPRETRATYLHPSRQAA